MPSPRLRPVVRTLQVLLTLALCVAVMGFVIPFTALATHVFPSHGLANIAYVIAGGVLGLGLGGLGAWATLRGEEWAPRPWGILVGSLGVVVLAAMAAARWLDAFAHV